MATPSFTSVTEIGSQRTRTNPLKLIVLISVSAVVTVSVAVIPGISTPLAWAVIVTSPAAGAVKVTVALRT